MIDGDIIPQRPTYVTIADQEDRSMPGKQWAEGLIIGDSQFDASAPNIIASPLWPIVHTMALIGACTLTHMLTFVCPSM